MKNICYKFLTELISQQELDKFNDIYYLSTCSNLLKEDLMRELEKNRVYNLLENCIIDNSKDSMDFFLFENSNEKNLVLIYNPFELFESSYVYKVIDF
jgi:hypothetical protein